MNFTKGLDKEVGMTDTSYMKSTPNTGGNEMSPTTPISLDDHAAAYAWAVRGERPTASERIRNARDLAMVTGQDEDGLTMREQMREQQKKSHVQEVKELYFFDPFLSDKWYGKMIEDAQERDDMEADGNGR